MGTTSKRRVYFNEYNVLMEGAAYLPLVSGTLESYAETFPGLAENYEFMPYLFYREDPEKIVAHYEHPSIAAFSISMWNEQLSLHVARELKRRFPECLIVLGGASVPYDAAEYFARHPFIDVGVRSEGEQPFADILGRFLESRDFRDVGSISWRDASGACVKNAKAGTQPKDLDVYPSPYLLGKFEPLIASFPHLQFQAIIETNRGCPFPCTFCYWGHGGLSQKYRFFSMERVRAILDWCGAHQIRYVFNADSNFGMLKRDHEIAEYIVATRQKYGFPDKFRTCFGKNSDDKIFAIGRLLHAHKLEKGITLSRQSNDATTLTNIRRSNIKLSTYRALQLRYNEHDIPIYSEFIQGLPGETYETWLDGLEEILRTGIKNQIFSYFCQVYPNTEMDDPDYRKKFDIKTVFLPLNEIHAAVRAESEIAEREEIVVATYSMPITEWRRMSVYSWVLQTLFSLKLGFYVMAYLVDRFGGRYRDFLEFVCGLDDAGLVLSEELQRFRNRAVAISEGAGRGVVMPEYGNIYFEEEEAAFLRICDQKKRFYRELRAVLEQFLVQRGIAHSAAEVDEAVLYQELRVASPFELGPTQHVFQHNMPEYFERLFLEHKVPVQKVAQVLALVDPVDYQGDRRRFMRDRVLFGRKSGTILHAVAWSRVEAERTASVHARHGP